LILNSERAASDSDVLALVKNADAIFFAGGDQSKSVITPTYTSVVYIASLVITPTH